MKVAPSQTQLAVLNLVRSWIADQGWPPTRAEIAKSLGWASPNAADEHLRALVRKGHVIIVPNVSRGIRLVA